jgi:cobalamin synthase
MTTNPLGKIGRYALWFSPVVIVVVGFVAAIPWLKQQNDSFVLALTAAVSIFVMGYSLFVSHRLQRHLDEVQIASAGFASSRGWVWGAMAAILLLLLPPVTNWLIDLANMLSTGSSDMSDRGAVQLALFFGLILVVLMQLVAVVLASAIWQRRMGGMREPS